MYQKSFAFYFKFALLQKKIVQKNEEIFHRKLQKNYQKKSLITKAAFTGVYTV